MPTTQQRGNQPSRRRRRSSRAQAYNEGTVPQRRGASQPSGNTGSLSATNPMGTRTRKVANTRGRKPVSGAARRPARGKHAAPSHAAPRKRGLSAGVIAIIVVVVVALGVGGFFLVRHLLHPYEGARVEDGQEVTVVIPEGSSGADIIDVLLDAGVIHSSKDFRKAAQEQNADQSLHSGTYTFVTGMDPDEVVRQLAAGSTSSEGKLQLPEGLTITQTAQQVEAQLGIPAKEFLAQAKASNYTKEYPFLKAVGEDSLEGFLYPKTYDFAGQQPTADKVIRSMLTQYAGEMHSLDMDGACEKLAKRYSNLTITNYDLLTMASIIEKEAIAEDDRPLVSSVFYNRLNSGMYLQSDATMGYVTNGAATAEDLQQESPYNTYLHGGLPPTPICSPSMWALEAAMEPAETDYLFFFIIENGDYSNHTFTKTYEEHDAAYAAALEEMAQAQGQAGDSGSKKDN